jgi:hypothetical protein
MKHGPVHDRVIIRYRFELADADGFTGIAVGVVFIIGDNRDWGG